MIRLRFAPSPTGYLHVGNARTALVNGLFARKESGTFILRLDDTDAERSRSEFADAIREDLRWLGLGWDEEYTQSARLDRYAAAAETLKAAGRLYDCYETPEELERWRKARQRRGLPPVYSRDARDDIVHARGEREGRPPHWRFAIDRGEGRRIAWRDLVRGPVEFDALNIADPVLVKSDGQPLYGLSSVVDDIELAISHVVRGEDHVANTAQQIQLFVALGADPARIAFAHLPLLTGADGMLSKREGALSLRDLRADGIEPMALNALLATLGTSDPIEPAADLDALAARFDWAKFGRASPQFDPAVLSALNARMLHDMPFGAVRDRLAALGLAAADDAFWLAVRPNISRLADAAEWWRIVAGPVEPTGGDRAFLADALATLPPEPWDVTTWPAWTTAIGARTGRKGKALFQPLRLALTGREHGPELKNLLPLIGRARAAARLSGQAA